MTADSSHVPRDWARVNYDRYNMGEKMEKLARYYQIPIRTLTSDPRVKRVHWKYYYIIKKSLNVEFGCCILMELIDTSWGLVQVSSDVLPDFQWSDRSVRIYSNQKDAVNAMRPNFYHSYLDTTSPGPFSWDKDIYNIVRSRDPDLAANMKTFLGLAAQGKVCLPPELIEEVCMHLADPNLKEVEIEDRLPTSIAPFIVIGMLLIPLLL